MNAETVREFLGKRPFAPFLIRLSNGESHEVRHPEADSAVHIGLIHVNSIQHLQAA